MRRTRVKICGITRPEDALAATEAGADCIGLVFWSGSKRAVSADRARVIRDMVPASITVVGVFVDATVDDVKRAVDQVGIDAAQLCGALPQDDWEVLARSTRLIRGVSLRNGILEGKQGEPFLRDYLIDNATDGTHGGTGIPFDWSLASQISAWGHVWVAGGLNSLNVADAIFQVRPHAVDVSTGVEVSLGMKSTERMREFIESVHHADHHVAKNNK